MAVIPVGYQRLIDQYKLSALSLTQVAVIDTRVKGREIGTDGTVDQLRFEARYAPEPTFEGDLQFALRYEGLNFEVLELLFTESGPQPLAIWLRAQPESAYARRAGFLYEWITGKELDVSALTTRTSYVQVLDETLQFGIGDGPCDSGFQADTRIQIHTRIIREFERQVHICISNGESGRHDADNGVIFVDQLEGAADD